MQIFNIASIYKGVVNSDSFSVHDFDILTLYPLDFEEFLWANGIETPVIELLKTCLQNEKTVPEALHKRMKQLLLQYTVVGGMPDVVQTFVSTKQMDEVLQIQRDIVRSYEDDMIKYAEKKINQGSKNVFSLFLNNSVKKIRNFSIQLSKRDLPLQSMLEACNGSRMQVLLCAVIILVLRNCL